MVSSKRSSSKIRWLRWGGTLFSSALFAWLLLQQDWQALWHTLSTVKIWVAGAAFGLYFAGIVANAARWYLLMSVQTSQISFAQSLKVVLSGNFASNFLPSTVGGDTVRMVTTSRSVGWAIGFTSVVVDRLINVFAMMTLLPFSWFTFKAAGILVWSVQARFLGQSSRYGGL